MPTRQTKKKMEAARKTKKSKSKLKQAEDGKRKYKQVVATRGPELEDELQKKGLRVKYMMADGNCFFRSLGDQLYGHDRNHLSIRTEVIAFMELNRELFQPFVEPCLEEHEDFDSYLDQMNQVGAWAGDFEVHAASLCYNADICIYQIDNETLQCLYNRSPSSSRVLHISYHGGEHYNSVRRSDDYGQVVPLPIDLDTSNQPKKGAWTWKDEKRIMEETGCFNDGLVHSFLEQCDGNVNEVIAKVFEWMEENNIAHKKAESDENNPLAIQGYLTEDENDQDKECSIPSEPSSSGIEDHRGVYTSSNKVLREDTVITRKKKPANNKPCPCGSKLAYKKCCKILDKKRERENTKELDPLPNEGISATNEMALLYI